MNKKLACTGVVLVGGESKRMGRNKALLEIDGKPLIQRSLEVLDGVCSQVLISCRETGQYEQYGFQTVPDLVKGQGPLGGLYAVLQKAEYDYVFMVACDMPYLSPEAVGYLYDRCEDYDAVLPSVNGKVHTLHAFYHRRIYPLLEKDLLENKLSIVRALFGGSLSELNKRVIEIDKEIADESLRQTVTRSLINVNTPQEWQRMVENFYKNTPI